jgi:predicted aldo/keto reductase-like oxidoreductase
LKFRKFGKLGWEASALGFGIMRLPVREKNYGDILFEESLKMVRYAIDHGVNYLDTAWNYHMENSEPFLGRALADGYRAKVKIATKMPCWLVEKPEDLDRFFDTQMERLQLTYIDFYLLHAIQKNWWDKMKSFHYIEWAEKKIADGVIGHIGFSFHDKFPLFKQIVDDYDNWALAMVQYNYMDAEREAGFKGVQYAADKGLAVVAMEPLRGGQLAKEPPHDVKAIFSKTIPGRSAADWGLKWLWNQKNISVVLSGMTSMEQLIQNLESADNAAEGCLTPEELLTISAVRKAYEEKAPILCTDCRYCMPCPHGVGIPFVFEYYNIIRMYSDLRMAKALYAFLGEENSASQCTLCGECMKKCPQHLDIINLLNECHATLYTENEKQD